MYVCLPRSSWGLLVFAVLVAPAPRHATASFSEQNGPLPSEVGPLVIDDVPEPLDPKRPRTEADEDRVEALSLFTAARMFERQERLAEALRLYQRALRFDPDAEDLSRQIVSLAFAMGRHGEAARYALTLTPAQWKNTSPWVLRDLGVHLSKQADWAGAVELYERATAAGAGEKKTVLDVFLQMEMGRLYHLIDQYDKSAECFARVLDALERPGEIGLDEKRKKSLLGKEGASYNLFGECFLLGNRLDEAEAAFKKAHQIAPNPGLWQFNLARIRARRGKPAEALDALQACFKEHLDDEGMVPYELLAQVLEDLGRKEELVARLEELHTDEPNNVPLGYYLAGQYLRSEQLKKAELLYVALNRKNPTLTGYRSLIEIYRKTTRPEPLLNIAGEAVTKTGTLEPLPAEVEAICGDAELMHTLVETAREKYRAEPKEFDYGMRLAVALLATESKQSDVAAEFFDLALKAEPDRAAELLTVWGLGLLLDEKPAEAAKVFQRAIDQKVSTKDHPAYIFHYYLAGAAAMEDRTEEALAAARKAVELNQDSPRFHARVAWVLYHAGRNDEAAKAYARLIEKFEDDHTSPDTRRVLRETRLVLSNLCVLSDDLPRAEEWLEQVLDEFPDHVGALNDLGYLWADQKKRLQHALKMIRRAVEAEPENVAYRDSLGWIFYRLGRYAEAVAELEKAAAGDGDRPPDAVILDHLGDAYLASNRPGKAKDAWQRAVEGFHKEEEPDKAKIVQKKIQRQS